MVSAVFFSTLERIIEQVPDRVSTMPAAQWLQWLDTSAPKLGVRKEEIETTGLRQHLADVGPRRLHKSELVEHVKAHALELTTTIRFGDVERQYDAACDVVNAGIRNRLPDDEMKRLRTVRDDFRDRLTDPTETAFAEYSLPGGENYREILISMPLAITAANATSAREHMRQWDCPDVEKHTDREIIDRAMESPYNWRPVDGFRDTHYSLFNVLAHFRIDERMDDDRKVMFIQEIQSDWAQAGKKEGFKGEGPVMSAEVEQALRKHYAELVAEHPRVLSPTSNLAEIMKNMGTMSMRDAVEHAGLSDVKVEDLHPTRFTVSPAPLVGDTKSWVGLAFKRALMLAVEEGYDRVAMITGSQAGTLFEKTQDIDRATMTRLGDGYEITACKGKEVVETRRVQNLTEAARFLDDELATQLFAKIEKAAESTSVKFSLGEHKVGDEGMRVFYDEIVPQVMRDVLKKLGGKLEEFQVAGADDQLGFDITPEMRKTLANGMPLFGSDPLVGLPAQRIRQAEKALDFLANLPEPASKLRMSALA